MYNNLVLNVITLVLFSCLIQCSYSTGPNVCKTFEDYETIANNSNCWYDPDVGSTPEEIIKRYGYPVERHRVVSKDGYIVTLFRVPSNESNYRKSNLARRTPVLLQHGIASDSASWLMRGKESPAFLLSNAGFDIWLGNARGTRYSLKHKSYSINEWLYWAYSFHEIGENELPAVIDYITKNTGQQIFYIGHSMGTSEAFVYASLKPDHAARNVKKIIALAPVAQMDHLRTFLYLFHYFRHDIYGHLRVLNLPALGNNVQHLVDYVHFFCSNYQAVSVCKIILDTASGRNDNEEMAEVLPVFFSNHPQGFSFKCVNHFAQIMERHGRFQFYDYGPVENMAVYGKREAPDYPIESIKIPIDLIYGSNDYLSEAENVQRFYNRLKTKKSIRDFKEYSHLDFLTGKSVKELYNLVIKLMNK